METVNNNKAIAMETVNNNKTICKQEFEFMLDYSWLVFVFSVIC